MVDFDRNISYKGLPTKANIENKYYKKNYFKKGYLQKESLYVKII